MVTPSNLLFCKFTPQEVEQISQLLCSVFESSPQELAELYQAIHSTFDQPGWLPHFAPRSFFKSASKAFQSTDQKSPVIAVDLPSFMELDDGRSDKPTIAIIGQDSKSDQDHEKISLGTPYGLHHKGSRELLRRTKRYFDMTLVLLELGYRVYLTDLLKVWVCDPDQRYVRVRLPNVDQQRFQKLIQPELAVVQPDAIVTWGKMAGNAVDRLQLRIKHLNFIHPSGAASGAWKKLIGESPTDANKLAYWQREMARLLSRVI